MKLLILLLSLSLKTYAVEGPLVEIDISKSTQSHATCSKLLSGLSLHKTFNFVFSGSFEQKENSITVNYKNLANQERTLNLEMNKQADHLSLLIKKGLFKDLLLNLHYKQGKDCEITGHLVWTGEEKRYPKSILIYSIDHYFDKLMSFLNRHN